jgi:hypothetical protein
VWISRLEKGWSTAAGGTSFCSFWSGKLSPCSSPPVVESFGNSDTSPYWLAPTSRIAPAIMIIKAVGRKIDFSSVKS